MNKLTAKTITDRDVRMLREEALAAQDYDQAAICDLALEGAIDMDDYTTVSREMARQLRGMTHTEAYQLCAEAINNARAQED